MTPNTKIKLIARTEAGQDQNGYPVWDETAREAGTKVSGVFALFRGGYQGEEILEHQGERFRVVRAYPKSLTEVELTCTSEKVDHGEV